MQSPRRFGGLVMPFAFLLCSALLGCVEPTDTLPVRGPDLTITQAGTWCRLVRFTITSDTTVTPDYPDNGCGGSNSGLLARKLIGQPMQWSAATRTLTVPIRIENRSSYSITLPIKVELPSSENNKKVIIPLGTSNTKIVPLNADSTRANGTKVWLAGGSGLLDAGDTSIVRSLTFQVDTPVVKGELWFVLKGEEIVVPAAPPATKPAWFEDDSSYADQGRGFLKGVLSVQFDSGATQSEKQAAVAAVGGVVIGGHPLLYSEGFYYLAVPDSGAGAQLHAAAATLRALSQVMTAELVYVGRTGIRRPNDGIGWRAADWTPFDVDSATTNWAPIELQLPLAWGCETGRSTVAIDVVDFGFDGSNYASNVAGGAGVIGMAPGSHGTYVANLLAARGDDSVGTTGVMWRAGLHLREAGFGLDTGELVGYVEAAAAAGHRIINLSWHLPFLTISATDSVRVRGLLREVVPALKRLRNAGTLPLLVTIAGNSGGEAWYAGYPALVDSFPDHVLVVGGSTRPAASLPRGKHSDSNYGSRVGVYAPHRVTTTDKNDQLVEVLGTSFAAPQVTGIAGLLLSFDSTLTPSQLKQLIVAGADSGGRALAGGHGKVADAYRSLRLASNAPGRPICGLNVEPVAGTGNSTWIRIGRTPAESVAVTYPGSFRPISVAQGGRTMATTGQWSAATQSTEVFTLVNGQWQSSIQTGPHMAFFLERDTAYFRYSESGGRENLHVRIGSDVSSRVVAEQNVTASAPTGLAWADWTWSWPAVSPTGGLDRIRLDL